MPDREPEGPSGAGNDRQFGSYRLLELLGRGGYSSVFRAEYVGEYGFRKPVALKILNQLLDHMNEQISQDFLNEVRLGASVRHTNLVEFYECGRVHNRLYIAMELVEGPNLRQLMDLMPLSTAPVGPDEIVALALQIARGLRALHGAQVDGSAMNVVHRDLKPGNILLDPEGQAKITDYGIARYTEEIYETAGLGSARGSPLYMAPEQARGEELTQACDVFSFATTMAELIVGEPLFAAATVAGVFEKVKVADASEAMDEARKRTPELAEVLSRCLRVDPADRYPSGSELVDALKQLPPPAHAEELIGTLATRAYEIVVDKRRAFADRPFEMFWSGITDDDEDEDSIKVRLDQLRDEIWDWDDDDAERPAAGDAAPDPAAGASRDRDADGTAEDAGGGSRDGEEKDRASRASEGDRDTLDRWAYDTGAGVPWQDEEHPAEDEVADLYGMDTAPRRSRFPSWLMVVLGIVLLAAAAGITYYYLELHPLSATGPGDETTETDEVPYNLKIVAPPEDPTPEPGDETAADADAGKQDDDESGQPDATGEDGSAAMTADAGTFRLSHDPITSADRDQEVRVVVDVVPSGRYSCAVWTRGGEGGSWRKQTIEGGRYGNLTVVIPAGRWTAPETTEIYYFIDVKGPRGSASLGSSGEPLRFDLR